MQSNGARRVLVLGAQGFLGKFTADALAKDGWRVVRGGRRPERASDFALVDLDRPDTVAAACRDVDLVVSTVRHPALVAEGLVLRDGPTLLNLDDLPPAERARLKAGQAASKGTVVDRSGLYGVAMLALRELLGRHPEADAVDYGFLVCVTEKAGVAGAALIHRLLHAPRRRPTTVIELPEPFGSARAIEAGPGAEGLVEEVVGGRTARVLMRFVPASANRALLALNALGVASRLPLGLLTVARGTPPPEPTRQPTCHWVTVRRRGEILASRVVRAAGDYRSSAAATVVFADAIAARVRPTGLFGIDEIVRLDDVVPALAARGITLEPAPREAVGVGTLAGAVPAP
jgi:NAD(P)-dependent dehydrogenase (short-subunit alcohol dehydrogenase family)